MPEHADSGVTGGGPAPEIDIRVEAPGWKSLPDVESLVSRAVEMVLEDYELADRGAVAVLLTGDEEIRRLNREYRNKDNATNVLSFPAADLPGEVVLGDIALAYETCIREAAEEGKASADHLVHLVVHGVLHLLGYDHETTEDAEDMEAEEVRILARLGVADPYAGTEPATAEREASP